MARQFQMESALLPQGWVGGARVSVDDEGVIGGIEFPWRAALAMVTPKQSAAS